MVCKQKKTKKKNNNKKTTTKKQKTKEKKGKKNNKQTYIKSSKIFYLTTLENFKIILHCTPALYITELWETFYIENKRTLQEFIGA